MNNLFIIAELSANHNNDIDLALKTIQTIAETGADAVKVQTYTADSLVLNVDNEFFGARKDGLWKGRRLYELYEEGSLPFEWHARLKEETERLGMVFFSSPFAKKDVDFLEELNVPLYKIASFEINDIPLIEYVASKGKPMIISTGVATLEDIELAVETCRKVGNHNITLLKCTSEYPARIEDANLLNIPDLQKRFKVKVGVSDHSMGSTVPMIAVALGATVIEKHVILDRSLGGVDSAFSMEPSEFRKMVEDCRDAYAALGSVDYSQPEKNKFRRRSLFVSKDIKKGEVITEENVRTVRPGNGMHPKYYNEIINTIATKDYIKGDPFFL
jgi:pseudaminic acid synthase